MKLQSSGTTGTIYILCPVNFVFSRLMTEERYGNVFYAEHLLCASPLAFVMPTPNGGPRALTVRANPSTVAIYGAVFCVPMHGDRKNLPTVAGRYVNRTNVTRTI